MAKLSLSLNFSLISLLLLAISPNNFVNSAAAKGGARCGYGYQKCHDGYKCVKQNRCKIIAKGRGWREARPTDQAMEQMHEHARKLALMQLQRTARFRRAGIVCFRPAQLRPLPQPDLLD